ncbi:MAG: DUF2853 family protein [Robiginitomaculum sp.]|nr:DUF2853 family protein [Robiginitomaculum sp.]
MANIISYITCFSWIPHLLMGLLGLLLGWFLFRGKVQAGDLSIEGEGQLRSDADGLRTRISDLEGRVGRRDTTISGLEGQLTAAPVASADGDDDETYALVWRNRYLAARVKYLEGRITDAPKPKKKKAAPKKKAVAKKAAPKKKVVKKSASKPQILYKTASEGKPDDLKLISGVGPKLEKLLNKNGVFYFRQIAAWNKGNVKMVNDKMDAFPGRIERDEWVRQAKGLAKGTATKPVAKKAAPKKTVAKKKTPANPNDKYYAMVLKHDAKASKSVIDNIVKYCGISLRSRDASLVACTDEKERDTIAKGFAVKKLGMKSGQAQLVADTCEAMKSTRMKNRVAFYYVMAKKAGKLSVFK